jgi:hypothetical protein
MPKAITLYACEICDQEYETEEDARKCESRGRDEERFTIGDVVVLDRYPFGWYDGDRAWVENFDEVGKRLNCATFCRSCCYRFYYVVTAIDRDDRDPHRVRYHLETKAMKDESGYRFGYTFNAGHHTPVKIPRPPAAVESGARVLVANGRRSSKLIAC